MSMTRAEFSVFKVPFCRHDARKLTVLMELAPHAD
jgi:hypothetical protein